MNTKNIKFLNEIKKQDLLIVGGKGLSLGKMKQQKFSVPNGFCVTTKAYRDFVINNNLENKILELSEKVIIGKDNQNIVFEIQKLFIQTKISSELKKEIIRAYQKLDAKSVAVRSSATAEDLPEASFAGQQDTYLNIFEEENLIKSIQKCWASLWTERAIIYRNEKNVKQKKVDIAVVIQKMIFADSSGVLFSINPVSNNKNEIVINASWGLGESIVSGLVTPDTLIFNKKTKKNISKNISEKKIMTVLTKTGSEEKPVPKEIQKLAVLSNQNILGLINLAEKIENYTKYPIDIEWAFCDGELFLLQVRPITTLEKRGEISVQSYDLMGMEWSRLMLIERYPDALTPFTESVMTEGFFDSFNEINKIVGIKTSPNIPMIKMMYGRPYINVTLTNQGFIEAEIKSKKKQTTKKELSIFVLFRVLKLLIVNKKEWDKIVIPFENEMRQKAKTDWDSFSTKDLLHTQDNLEKSINVLLCNHSKSLITARISLEILQSVTKKWFNDDNKNIATLLISGLTGNKTVETNHNLWFLAQKTKKYPKLSEFISRGIKENWREEIMQLKGGEDTLAEIDDFLKIYGHRSPKYELAHPTWTEKPKMLLDLLGKYITNNLKDPKLGAEKQKKERIEMFEKLLGKLPFYKKLIFKMIVKNAQRYFQLRENQQFYIMLQLPITRKILLILGKRLQSKKIIELPKDIFYLTPKEIKAMSSKISSLKFNKKYLVKNILTTIKNRKRQTEKFQKMIPPIHLGAKIEKEDITDKKTLKGVAASCGKISGKARIILTPDDFHLLKTGEILVAPATTPAWTPLFGVASGLVTDYGGLLSHSGVVAREYGLPAVLGTNNATKVIKNGDVISVNGETGVITLI